MAGKPKNDPKETQRRLNVLRASSTLQEACRKLGLSGASNLIAWFASRGIDAHAELVSSGARPAITPVDPVERRERELKAARHARENKTLADEVTRLREALAFRDALAAEPLKPIKRLELGSGLREGTAVAMLSDMHVEEKVRPGDTPTGNAYSLAIADLRLRRFFSGVEWLIEKERSSFKIRNLILSLTGDGFSGHIHAENVETSALAPIAAARWLRPRLVSGIRQLADRLKLERLLTICSYGNHGRDTLKPRRATGAHHSYEWNMYQELALDLKDDRRIEVLADPSAHQYTQAYDFDLHFHHGDEVNYGGGVGGITIPLNKAVAGWDRVRRAHYHHFGHFHQYIDTGNVLVNGSLIGYNAYAMSIKASPERPQQAFYVLDSKRGKTAKSAVWVDDPEAELAIWKAGE